MEKCKYIIVDLVLIYLLYSFYVFYQGIVGAVFEGFSNSKITDSGLEKVVFIVGVYLMAFVGLFLFFWFSLKKEKVERYGLKTCMIFTLSFVIGCIIVPHIFAGITKDYIKETINLMGIMWIRHIKS